MNIATKPAEIPAGNISQDYPDKSGHFGIYGRQFHCRNADGSGAGATGSLREVSYGS